MAEEPIIHEPTRIDRRKRHADDPTMPITVIIPVSLLAQLDDFVVENNATRSGMIRIAVAEMLRAKSNVRKITRTKSYPRRNAKRRLTRS